MNYITKLFYISFITAFPIARRIGHPYQNRTPPKRKKPRTSFTRIQVAELEKRFHKQKYLASAERAALARGLKMTDAQVRYLIEIFLYHACILIIRVEALITLSHLCR